MTDTERMDNAINDIYFDFMKADKMIKGRYSEDVCGCTLLECVQRMKKNLEIIEKVLDK